jgi:hypothetical protein
MQTFTRTKTAQNKDRYVYLVFCLFLSLLFLGMGIMGLATGDIPFAAVLVVFATAMGLLVLGIWLFKRNPVITAIQLSDRDLIIEYLHHPTRTIPRIKIVGVSRGMAAQPQGSYNCLIIQNKKDHEYLAIHGGYKDEAGRFYGGRAMVKKLQELLVTTPDDGVDNDESGVWHYGRS